MGSANETAIIEKIKTHKAIMPLLRVMFAEFKALSKKNPDTEVSRIKIKIVNRLLEKIRSVFKDEELIDFLDLLDEDELPQASDVTLILSQYFAAMQTFSNKYSDHFDLEDARFRE